MIKQIFAGVGLFAAFVGAVSADTYIDGYDDPYSLTDYINKDDTSIVAWATDYQDLIYGSSVSDAWKTPERALGPAVGSSYDIVSLGRGGQITLTFTNAIRNGYGADFCVFENGFSDTFLELAWVEVSSDGEHFVRFPNFSLTASATASNIQPELVFGLASRYRQGRGTPFDLEQIKLAAEVMEGEPERFSDPYRLEFEANIAHVDLNDIRYVRVVDVVGDGFAYDAEGYIIYDAYPTSGSAGFDLEAVGVLNRVEPSGLAQVITFPEISNQRLADGSVSLLATASSDLAVEYRLLSGSPATLDGDMLTFTGTGTVQVLANQAGDSDYVTAEAVLRSFVVADDLQHLYFEPIANQLVGATGVPLSVVSSGGLAVQLEVTSGPSDVVIMGAYPSFTLDVGVSAGTVTIRAWQAGDSSYAPAEDVYLNFEVVAAGSENAPLRFAQWQSGHTVGGDRLLDTDGDGANDFLEYVAGTDPNDASESVLPEFVADEDGFVVSIQLSRRAPVRVNLLESEFLSSWSLGVPEIVSIEPSGSDELTQTLRLRLMRTDAARLFWRCDFDSL